MFDGIIEFIGSGVIPIFLAIIVLVLIVSYIASRYKVAGANEALVVSGQRDKEPDGRKNLKVVRGGGVVVLPLVHKVGLLKLTARQINVHLADAVTRQGIKVAVQGVATFKIGADDESIRNAAERFLDAREEEVDSIVKNVLEGSLRSIVGTLTVEELNLDRMKFQQAVQDAAKGDLATSGLQIDSFTIQAIRDESGYMELIGQQETARRERDARMAKAAADQEAAVREAEAEQVKINAQRDVALRRAETETQTAAAEARAAQAGPLAEAEATQEVTRKQTELAQLEAARTQQELVATTVRPAEAEAEAQIRRAEGAKGAAIATAQGEAERVKLAGEAQARVVEMTAEATAKQTTLEGNAEAGIVLSKGEAEAKALALRAEAYRQFNEAAIIQTVLSMLPDIVRAAAEPMSHIDSLTVLSNEGASDMVKNVTRTVTEASTTVKGLTGIDIPELLNKALGNTPDEPTSGGQKATKPPTPPRGGSGSSGSGSSGSGGSTPPSSGGASASGSSGSAPASASASGAAPAARTPATAPTATEAPPPRFETAGGRRRGDRRCRCGAPTRRGHDDRPADGQCHRPGPTGFRGDRPRDDGPRGRRPAGDGPAGDPGHRALQRGQTRPAREGRPPATAQPVAIRQGGAGRSLRRGHHRGGAGALREQPATRLTRTCNAAESRWRGRAIRITADRE